MPETAQRQKCKKIFIKTLHKTPIPADTAYRPIYQKQQ
jgi:hypothetical protein